MFHGTQKSQFYFSKAIVVKLQQKMKINIFHVDKNNHLI